MSLSLLKKWFVTSCCNSFLLYCQLLVLSERMNTSFWGSVASPFYPLEGNPLLSQLYVVIGRWPVKLGTCRSRFKPLTCSHGIVSLVNINTRLGQFSGDFTLPKSNCFFVFLGRMDTLLFVMYKLEIIILDYHRTQRDKNRENVSSKIY